MAFKTQKPVCYSEIKHISCTNQNFVLGLRFLAGDHSKSAPQLRTRTGRKNPRNNAWAEEEDEEENRKRMEASQKRSLEKQKLSLEQHTISLHEELQLNTSRVGQAEHEIEVSKEEKSHLQLKLGKNKLQVKKLSHVLVSQKSDEQILEDEIRVLSEKIAKIDAAAAKIKQMSRSMIGPAKINLRRRSVADRDAVIAQQDISWFEHNLASTKSRKKADPTNHVLLSQY
jgi:hypothetical protein